MIFLYLITPLMITIVIIITAAFFKFTRDYDST